MSSSCPACQGHCVFFASATVLGKYEAQYVRCANCGSIHIPNPHWLDEAYTEAIATTDIGLAARAIDLSQIISLVVTTFFRDAKRFLDYAGGNGLLVRLMRDRGYAFTWNDRFAANLFARPFEGALDETYDVVTVVEVLEHLPQPHDTLAELCALAPTIIATTELLPEPAPLPHDWWYYSLGTGQHVTFFTQRGLDALAARHGRRRQQRRQRACVRGRATIAVVVATGHLRPGCAFVDAAEPPTLVAERGLPIAHGAVAELTLARPPLR